MGVTGLWTVLQPCARPIKIETLNKKRLAVDASIWIYQFLKAVRDKEGNALRNSHIVGFFRRICKLLFYGIKPVFVFDGGAPALKRQTINNRKSRREGRREDAVRTAGKLLAIQMQRVAEEEEKRRKEAARQPQEEPEEEIPENIVYADEVLQSQQERMQNRKFRKKDQYHLPDLGASLAEMGGQNDPRIMSLEELEEYARQFDRGEDINVYDFSKIDFDSPFFTSLPAVDRYNILNAARLRSRLRLGLSKDQLDHMFPDRMAFSRFQIERVRERNDLTQRLMNLNGMGDEYINRVASARDREYVLVKNDGVEGGWALGVVSNKDEGNEEKPIDVDRPAQPEEEEEEWEDEDDFEDVPIEGLNRLPKPKPTVPVHDQEGRNFVANQLAARRRKLYNSRKAKSPQARPRRTNAVNQDPDSLFFAEDKEDEEWEPVDDNDLFEEPGDDEEEEQLQKAIALSLGTDAVEGSAEQTEEEGDREDPRDVYQQRRAAETNPFSKGSGITIARQANIRSSRNVPKVPFEESISDGDDMDLQSALSESKKKKAHSAAQQKPRVSSRQSSPAARNLTGFSGPLPFQKLDLGGSILGRKRTNQSGSNAGREPAGIVNEVPSKSKLPQPRLGKKPSHDISMQLASAGDKEKVQGGAHDKEQFQKGSEERESPEITSAKALPTEKYPRRVFNVESDSEEEDHKTDTKNQEDDEKMEGVLANETNVRMDDLATRVRAEPPKPLTNAQRSPPKQDTSILEDTARAQSDDDEPIEWSESEPETERISRIAQKNKEEPPTVTTQDLKSPSPEFEDVLTVPPPVEAIEQPGKSPSPEFEDVPINQPAPPRRRREPSPFELQGAEDLDIPVVPPTDPVDHDQPIGIVDDDSDQYSDPEDAELFASLAAEAEEHSRFAQELNNLSGPVDFDSELKQLRAQQKKDRRDADEVTQTMILECQHLLTLFGLPYITAPMEAEAQCAELVRLGLVDGIVTDDSDTFLFGGTRVYKNMFNAAKFVECYLAHDLEAEFSLTREKLIAIAQLLGSDYTTGIPGIGPVTALEIISEFNDLAEFRDWWTGVQEGRISKEADKASQFRRRFRRSQTTKLFLPTNFPDPRVREAYLEPDVDSDPQPFQWGVPDLDALRTYLSSQIGWSWERTDEVLVPVVRDMNRREKEGTQANITRFFDGSVGAGAFAPRIRDQGAAGTGGMVGKKGKGRLGAALTRLAEREKGSNQVSDSADSANAGASANDGEMDNALTVAASTERAPKSRKRKGDSKGAKKAAPALQDDDDVDGDATYTEPKKKRARTSKTNKTSS